MKGDDVKYQEAVDRNLLYAAKKPQKYSGKTLEQAKHAIGIRAKDDRYDDQVTKLIETPKKAK